MAPRVITVTHYFALVFSSLFSLFAGGAVVHALLAPDLVRARARVLLLQRVPCTRCPLSPPSLSLSSPPHSKCSRPQMSTMISQSISCKLA